MKDGLREIVGKQIVGVVIAERQDAPQHQVFLLFTDGTSLELYGESFNCRRTLDPAEGVLRYAALGRGKIVATYGEVSKQARQPP